MKHLILLHALISNYKWIISIGKRIRNTPFTYGELVIRCFSRISRCKWLQLNHFRVVISHQFILPLIVCPDFIGIISSIVWPVFRKITVYRDLHISRCRCETLLHIWCTTYKCNSPRSCKYHKNILFLKSIEAYNFFRPILVYLSLSFPLFSITLGEFNLYWL